MRLRFKLMAATLLFTCVLTAALSLVFLSEILRERVAQTDASNTVVLHQMLSATRSALENGLKSAPPEAEGEANLQSAVRHALENDRALSETLASTVRYSPGIQDAFLSDSSGRVLISTDPANVTSSLPSRRSFTTATSGSLLSKRSLLFGPPETLDVVLPLQRNGQPFLSAHLGLRSTFLRNSYEPWLRDAVGVCLLALLGALVVAGVLSAVAVRPLLQINRELEVLSGHVGEHPRSETTARPQDAIERVNSTISRLDKRIRSNEQERTELSLNLNSMLQTLKDGVMVFNSDLSVAMASESCGKFLPSGAPPQAGASLAEVFPRSTVVGALLSDLVAERSSVRDQAVTQENGRMIEVSLEYFTGADMGPQLTLHDVAAQEELEQEIKVARRLASIGRLTAGVGHEVKNPINAMVVHLELLRNKLKGSPHMDSAQRHVDVLASEMNRLDRVVQTLADFSRPLEPSLKEQDLRPVLQAVVELVSAEADRGNVALAITEESDARIRVVADAELLRQAMLNIVLNAMQAMPEGGVIHMNLSRDTQSAILTLHDTGAGIPEDKLPHIFDLYFTTKESGSGIGLAMTYRILQLHGGLIEVASDADPVSPTRGTTFTLRLPLAGRTSQIRRAVAA